MTEGWELVELIGQTLEERNITASEQTVEAILDSIENLIRADEREKVKAEYVPVLMEHLRILANLHDRVEALPWIVHTAPAEEFVLRADVLALIDGGSDE